jgi:hypothetical protein
VEKVIRSKSAMATVRVSTHFFCFWLSKYAGLAIDFINNLSGATPVISSTDTEP